MFSRLFPPTCPCDPSSKRWVEDRLRWLTAEFGLHVLLERDVVTPTPEHFPDPYDGSPAAVRVLFRRVCEAMAVDPGDVQLKLFDDTAGRALGDIDPGRGFAAGTWSEGERWRGGNVVRVERSTLDRPADLIGTLAHELAHQKLMGEGRVSGDESDNELLTDLTATFHGFGVFLANNPRKHHGEVSRWPGTELVRPEYMSAPMLGYALAHLAWFRDEERPAWAKHLRWAPRGTFHQGLRFLQKTGDSTFQPVRLR